MAGGEVQCDDSNPCTVDACDPAIGCVAPAGNDGAECDDDDACTEDDACSGGTCAGAGITCDDGDPCTEDSCDPVDGCDASPADPDCGHEGVIIAWTGGLGSIPPGWALCDGDNGTPDLRSHFVKGAEPGVEPGATGGSDSDHDHDGTTTTSLTTGTTSPSGRSCSGASCTWKTANTAHSHDFTHDHPIPAEAALPPYYEVLFLMSVAAAPAPEGAIVQWSDPLSTVPPGWGVCDGISATPDLTGRFLRGAPAGVAPGASGGAETHDHGGATVEVTSTSAYNSNFVTVGCYGPSATDGGHSHNFVHDHAVTASAHVPAHHELAFLRAQTAGGLPVGVVAMWSGPLADIPNGWIHCDGSAGTPDLRGAFTRGAPLGDDPGATGGADSHTHSLSDVPAGETTTNGGGNGNCSDGGPFMAFHSHSVPSHGHAVKATSSNDPVWHGLAFIMRL